MERSNPRSIPVRLRLLLAGIGAVACMGAGDAPGALVQRSFCAPTFRIDGAVRPSGTGFLLYGQGSARHTYLFTAQHLFSISPSDMASRVTAAACASPVTAKTYPTGPALIIEGAHPMGPLAELKDVAVFPVRGRSPGLTLADTDVAPGAAVWLLAKVKSGPEMSTLLHRAVAGRSEGYLVYRFDDQTIGLDQTSGGAVLNGVGEVVGLNIGYGRAQNGALVGVADRLTTLRGVVAGLP